MRARAVMVGIGWIPRNVAGLDGAAKSAQGSIKFANCLLRWAQLKCVASGLLIARIGCRECLCRSRPIEVGADGDLINDRRRNEPPVHLANSWSGVRSAVQSTKTNSSSSSGHERAGACQPSIGRQRQLCFIAGILDCSRAGALTCWTIAFMVASMLILPGTS